MLPPPQKPARGSSDGWATYAPAGSRRGRRGTAEADLRVRFVGEYAKYMDWSPTVIFGPEAEAQQWNWMQAALPNEVGWVGMTEVDKHRNIHIRTVFLPHQEANPGSFKCDFAGLHHWLASDKARWPWIPHINFIGHSHADGNVFVSAHDDDPDHGNLTHFRKGGHQWALRGIFNTLGDCYFDLHIWVRGTDGEVVTELIRPELRCVMDNPLRRRQTLVDTAISEVLQKLTVIPVTPGPEGAVYCTDRTTPIAVSIPVGLTDGRPKAKGDQG